MDPIPFRLPDMSMGLVEGKGDLTLDDEYVILNFETALMGEWDRDERIVKVEPGALEAVELKRGLVQDEIRLRPRKAELLEAIPGNHTLHVTLKVWRHHRHGCEMLVAELAERIRLRDAERAQDDD